jgi:basic membrane protein A
MRRRFGTGVIALTALLALALLPAGAPGAPQKLRIALVLANTGLNDPFQAGGVAGLRRAVEQLGIEGRIFVAGARENPTARFASVAALQYDLVFGLGFTLADFVDGAAVKVPQARFAIVDAPHDALKHRPKNVASLIFREEEAGYLAGYLAALVERRRPGADAVSAVGGFPVPAVRAFIGGYRAGARNAVPGITVLVGYSQSWSNPAKCKAVALAQIAKGSGVVFQVASGCGFGALEAAKVRGAWGIGVDLDQSSLGPHILTSAVKRLDVAVFETIEALQRGRFAGGRDTVFDVRSGGVGLGKISPKVPRAFVLRVERIRRQIASGAIRVPST